MRTMTTVGLLIASVAVDARAQDAATGKLVLVCKSPLRYEIGGHLARCGPSIGRKVIRLTEGQHDVVWHTKSTPPTTVAVAITAGRPTRLTLPSQSPMTGTVLASVTRARHSAPAAPAAPGEPASSRFIKHGDGTVTDTATGLMWTEKDSTAELGRCLSPYQAKTYVEFLRTAGHQWRLPTPGELADLIDPEGALRSRDAETLLHLNPAFAEGGARYHWSAATEYREVGPNGVTALHGVTFDFRDQTLDAAPCLGACTNVGVRAVRSAQAAIESAPAPAPAAEPAPRIAPTPAPPPVQPEPTPAAEPDSSAEEWD